MSEDLQSLLEKINRDGIEKANKEAAEIIESANKEAARITAEAKESARKIIDESKVNSEEFSKRAVATIKQAARDIEISVENALLKTFDKLLVKDVKAALGESGVVKEIVASAIKELTSGATISANGKIADALRAELAGQKQFEVVTDDTIGSGFTIKLDGGRIESSFTGETIAAELARRLRPELAEIIKQ